MRDGLRDTSVFFLALAAVFAVTMMGTTLPTPLYPIYQAEMGFSQLVITVIFAAYAVGVIAALIVTGAWSDQIGRRPMLALGLVLSAASAACFLMADGLSLLLVGRLLSGFSAGIFTGTATVAVVEMAPLAWQGRATLIATAANMGGLGFGPFLAGCLAEYLAWPLHLCFIVDLLAIAAALGVVTLAPETAERPARPRLTVRRPSVPREVIGVFVPAAIAGFAGFAVLGLFTAVAPAVVGSILGYDNHALTGAIVFGVFIGSIVGQSLQGRLPEAARLPVGCLGLIVGMAGVIAAIATASLTGLILGGLVAGAGQGAAFRAGMGAITAASPIRQRAEVASTFFVVAYVAISIPVMGLGAMAARFGLASAGISFAAMVSVLAAVSALILIRRPRTPNKARR